MLEWAAIQKLLIILYMRELFSIGFLLYYLNGGILSLGKLLDSMHLLTVVLPYVLAICGDSGLVKGVSDVEKIVYDLSQ